MNDKLIDEIKYIAKGVLIFNLIVLAIFLIISALDMKMFLGLMFGTIIAILNIILLAKSIEKSVTMPVNKAQIYTTSTYLLRMLIVAIVLIVSVKASHLSLIGVVIGIISPKFSILVKPFIMNKLDRKEA